MARRNQFYKDLEIPFLIKLKWFGIGAVANTVLWAAVFVYGIQALWVIPVGIIAWWFAEAYEE